MAPERANDAQDLGDVVARCDERERVPLGRNVPASPGRVHAADPAPEREADDPERATRARRERIAEHLLEAEGGAELVAHEAWPKRPLARRPRRDRHEVRAFELPVAAK